MTDDDQSFVVRPGYAPTDADFTRSGAPPLGPTENRQRNQQWDHYNHTHGNHWFRRYHGVGLGHRNGRFLIPG